MTSFFLVIEYIILQKIYLFTTDSQPTTQTPTPATPHFVPPARVETNRRGFAHQLVRVQQRGQPGRDPGDDRGGALLVLLDLLPVPHHVGRRFRVGVAEHVRMAADELV